MIMAGLAVLSVAPLLSSTASLIFTFSEDIFLRGFVHASPTPAEVQLRHHANRILPTHLNHFFRPGLTIIFTTYPLSIATAAANIARHDTQVNISGLGATAKAAAGFYIAGLAFSVLHFPFGPTAMRYIKQMREDQGVEGKEKEDNVAIMGKWLKINAIRGAVADFPAWACYFVAFVLSMS